MKANSRGQVLLITLLILAVASTVIIGVIGRTTTETAITDKGEESSRAFSAAEAGVEQVLKTGQAIPTPSILPNQSTYSVATKPFGEIASGIFPAAGAINLKQGQVYTLWLVSHNASGQIDYNIYYTKPRITICFDTSIGNRAALEVTTISRTQGGAGIYYTHKNLYDKLVRQSNGSEIPAGGSDGQDLCSMGVSGADIGTIITNINYQMCGSVNPCAFNPRPIFMRIKPVYADTRLRFSVSSTDTGAGLPAQGQEIEGTGVSSDGKTTSKIRVTTSYRAPSALFDYVLYSQGSGGLQK